MAVGLVLILGFALRLISLNQSFWLDEAVQVWASRDFGIKDLLFEYMKGDFNPPLFHFLLHFWIKIFGDSEVSVRMPSVILGVGSIWLVYKTAVLLFHLGGVHANTSKVFWLSALLLATSPLHIYYSQEARMYSLTCFSVLLMIWRFLIWQKKESFKNGLFLGTSLVFMGFSHYLTLLVLPAMLIFIYSKHGRGSVIKKFGLILLPLILFFLLYLPIFNNQLKTGIAIKNDFSVWGETVGSFSLKSAALLPIKFIIGRISMSNKIAYGITAAVLVVIFWGITLLEGAKNLKLKIQNSKLQLKIQNFNSFLFALLLFLSPTLGFIVSFFVPVFSYFRFLFVLPFFYLLIGFGIEKIKKRNLKRLVIIFLVGINLTCSFIYLFNSKFHREDWKGMVDWLDKQEKAPLLILSQVSKPLEYYSKSDILFWPQDEEKIKENGKIWLIEYALPIFDPQKTVKGGLLEQGFVLIEQKSFREIILSFWEKEVYAYRY